MANLDNVPWQFRDRVANQTKGLGTKKKQSPISVKLPPEIDSIVRSLPDRSEKLREWIIEGMKKDGLIE
jgi:hypothetical protein